MAYKQHKFISHSSGGRKVQDHGAWWGPTSKMVVFLLCPHMSKRAKKLSQVSFIRVAIPCVRALPSWSNHISKAPPPNTITLGIRISTYAFWGNINIQIIAERMYGNTTLFLNKFIKDGRNYGTPKCICPFGYTRMEWMAEFIMLVLEDIYPLYTASQEHTRVRPRTPVLPMASWQVGHTHLDATSLSSCVSLIWHDCSPLIIVFYHHRISVDSIKQPTAL